ncbi:UNVERIFIED_CONTAM: hypothetical protein Sradi_7291300 [Sesamum radiatum]|uniref:Uncharacterized protein n=1 Tax=Sesamum radiatum TaxID=300843 RepID=A0AAW2IHZ3_SESRA
MCMDYIEIFYRRAKWSLIWLKDQNRADLKDKGSNLEVEKLKDQIKKTLKIRDQNCFKAKLSKKQFPKTDDELKRMFDIPYASAVGCIQYAVQWTAQCCLRLSVTSRYQACASEGHWSAVKIILNYLRRTKRYVLDLGWWRIDTGKL